MLYFLLAAMAVAIAAIVNAIARRPVLNGGRIGLIGVGLLMVVAIGLSLAQTGNDSGQRVGYVLGQALLPLLACAYLDRRHAKTATAKP